MKPTARRNGSRDEPVIVNRVTTKSRGKGGSQTSKRGTLQKKKTGEDRSPTNKASKADEPDRAG